MADLSYLDTISNKELHQKCLQHGLPNIPVTDSSRQVILRRLRATILGVPLNKSKSAAAAANKTPRRETVHGSKATPPVERAAAAKIPSQSNNNRNNRRTVAATPSNYYPVDNSTVRSVETTTTVSDLGSQSEDDDYYAGILSRNKNSQPQARAENERSRRSVSLTKSGVLTTSYTREVEQPTYEQAEQPQSFTYRRPQVAPMHTLPSYVPQYTDSPRQRLTQTQLNSTSYSQDAVDYNEQAMRQTSPPQPPAPRHTYSGSAQPFNVRQRQTTAGSGYAAGQLLQPSYRGNALYPQLDDFYEQQNVPAEPMDVETDSESEVELQQPQPRPHDSIESPYMSRFSRQLNASKRSSPLARPQMRASTRDLPDPNSPMQQFRTLLTSLDRKYHLKFYFILTLAVMFATMIYVLLTP